MKHAAQILYDSFSVRIDSRDAGLVVRLSLGRDQTLRFPLDHEYLAVAPRVRQGMVSTPALIFQRVPLEIGGHAHILRRATTFRRFIDAQ